LPGVGSVGTAALATTGDTNPTATTVASTPTRPTAERPIITLRPRVEKLKSLLENSPE
jgi:hypothetical protein